MAEPPVTTLRYFACRGRAEPLRMMLHDTATPFNDHVVRFPPPPLPPAPQRTVDDSLFTHAPSPPLLASVARRYSGLGL
jgi:hypothetical protein